MNRRTLLLATMLAVAAAGCALVTHFDRDDPNLATVVDGGVTTIAPFTATLSLASVIDVTAKAHGVLTLDKSTPEPLHVSFALAAGAVVAEGNEIDVPADAPALEFTVDVAGVARGQSVGTIRVQTSDGSIAHAMKVSFTVTGPGDLDPTFGKGGVVVIPTGTRGEPRVREIVADGDRVLIVGSVASGSEYWNDWALGRVVASGVDPSFGDAGVLVESVGYASSEAQTALMENGGALLVSGAAQFDGGGDRYETRLRRYAPDGQYLGAGDGVLVGVGHGLGDDSARSAMMAKQGTRVWAVATDNYNVRAVVAEVSDNGVIAYADTDMPLGPDLLGVSGGGGDENAGDLAVVGGRLLLAAPSEYAKGTAVIGYALSGANANRVDATFGTGGVTVDPKNNDGARTMFGIVPRPDGSFLVVGAHGATSGDLALGAPFMATRAFDAQGKPDPSVAASLDTCPGALFRGVLDAQGRTTVVGYFGTATSTTRRVAIVRLAMGGGVDTSFGNGHDGAACTKQVPGAGTPSFASFNAATASAVALDAQGRVLVGGWGLVGGASGKQSYSWFVARFRPD